MVGNIIIFTLITLGIAIFNTGVLHEFLLFTQKAGVTFYSKFGLMLLTATILGVLILVELLTFTLIFGTQS